MKPKMLKLDTQQQEAVDCGDPRVLVRAAAGSGKTLVIVERFMRAVREKVPLEKIVAITYTDKAAQKLKADIAARFAAGGRLGDIARLENVSTIHGFCRALLKDHAIDAGLDPGFTVLDEDVARLLQSEAMERVFEKASGDPAFAALFEALTFDKLKDQIRAVYGRWRSSAGEPRPAGGSALAGAFAGLLRMFASEYAAMKRERAGLDFEDLVRGAVDALTRDPVLASRIAGSFELVLVDEYQDVNPLQARLLDLVSAGSRAFYVGDVRQSIYAFRHADCREFLRKEAGWTVKSLDRNRRSLPHIIAFVNGLFGDVPVTGKRPFGRMNPYEKERETRPEIRILTAEPDDDDADGIKSQREREAAAIASEIRSLASQDDGFKYRDVAVLLRSRTALEIYQDAMKRAGIRYHVYKGRGFYHQSEIEDILAVLHALLRPDDDIAFASALKSPLAGLSDDSLYLIRKRTPEGPFSGAARAAAGAADLPEAEARRLRRFFVWFDALSTGKKRLTPDAVIGEILAATDYDAVVLAGDDGTRRRANLVKLREKAAAYARTEGGGLSRFVRYVKELKFEEAEETEAAVEAETDDAVKIMTIHSAKGLQFEAVFVADMGNKKKSRSAGPILPDSMELRMPPAEGDDAEAYAAALAEIKGREDEEELRVMYVAFTRARKRLYLSGAVPRKPGKAVTWIEWVRSRLPAVKGVRVRIDAAPEAARAAGAGDEADFERRIAMLENPDAKSDEAFVTAALARFEARDKGYFETLDLRVTELADYIVSGELPPEPESAPAEADAGRGAASGAEFGILYHSMLQHADFTADAAGEISRLLSVLGPHLEAAQRMRMRTGLERFFASPHAAALRRAAAGRTPFYRELPFLYRVAEGPRELGFLSGQVDLLYPAAKNRWVLVDYKTGRESAAHDEQLRIYAHCIGSLLGLPVASAEVYYSEQGASRMVDLAPLRDGAYGARITPFYARLREQTLGRRRKRGFCREPQRGMLEYRP